jgi:hypothetical protein
MGRWESGRSASAGLRRGHPDGERTPTGRASRGHGALGIRVLTRPEDRSLAPQPLAGTRARTLAALADVAAESSPAARAPSLLRLRNRAYPIERKARSIKASLFTVSSMPFWSMANIRTGIKLGVRAAGTTPTGRTELLRAKRECQATSEEGSGRAKRVRSPPFPEESSRRKPAEAERPP